MRDAQAHALTRVHAPAERGGVLIAYLQDGALVRGFIPGDVALRLTTLSAITDVPGTHPPARGVGLADGEVVTVIALGPPCTHDEARRHVPLDDWPVPGSDRALICLIGGQEVAVVGGQVLATGLFEPSPSGEGVLFCGQPVPMLDVRALYAQAEAAIWAPRTSTVPANEGEGEST